MTIFEQTLTDLGPEIAQTVLSGLDQLDLLEAVADNGSPLGGLRRDDFELACRSVAFEGLVNPNLVSAWLAARFGEVNPRWYSAQWAPACGPSGFMDKTDEWVPIDGAHSKGNSNKSVRLRRIRNTDLRSI